MLYETINWLTIIIYLFYQLNLLMYALYHVLYSDKYISLQRVCYSVRVTRRVKKPAKVQVWVRIKPACGYGFLEGRVRVDEWGMEQHYPTGFYLLPSLRAVRLLRCFQVSSCFDPSVI
jgi:hypothetical protein